MFSGHEFTDVRKALEEFPILDTHEHYGEVWDSPETTLYELLRNSYVAWCAHPGPLEARPEAVLPWLAPARYNSYPVSYLRGLSELYGLPLRELETADFTALAEKVRAAYRDPKWPLRVLRQAGIAQTIVDPLPDPGYLHGEPSFHLTLRAHALVHGYDRGAVDHGGISPFVLARALQLQYLQFRRLSRLRQLLDCRL